MKRANGTYVDELVTFSGGLDGGGWTTGLDIAPDGRMVNRNDTGTAYFRDVNDTEWTLFHRFGISTPVADYEFKVPNHQYEIAIAHGNTDVIWSIARGRVWKSTDFGANVSRVMTFKSGNTDTTFTWSPDVAARIGGHHIGIDPNNENVVGLGHPVDGLYITTNGGSTTINLHPSLPTPLNETNQRRGINIAFDKASTVSGGKTQTVVVGIPGRGIYKSTTGLDGSYTLLSGGPLYSSSIAVHNGRIYVCGNGANADTQLYIHNGSSWSQPTLTGSGNPVTGMSVSIKPDDPTKVVVGMIGGGRPYSTDTGATWTLTNNFAFRTTAADVPWLEVTNNNFESLGRCVWEVRSGVNRWVDVNGIGAFAFDNPPRTALEQKFYSISKGIKQMLMMDAKFLPDGAVLMTGQDRPFFRFEPGQATQQVAYHGPDYLSSIRHSVNSDYAPDNPDYVVITMANTGVNPTIMISTGGGREGTWAAPAVIPASLLAGEVIVPAEGKIIWAPQGGQPMKYSHDGGATWNNPTFRHTEGGDPITVPSNAYWNHHYTARRHVCVGIKERVGEALAYCNGLQAGSGTGHSDMVGIWKTTDSGANWVRIRSTHIVSHPADFWQCKLRPVPGYPDHAFWVTGNQNSYPTAPAANGIYFSTNQGTNFITLSGWAEPEDIAFSKNPTANPYPRLYVKGWRNSAADNGIWVCDDFDPNSPNSAAWTLLFNFPGGRPDTDCLLAADPLRPFQLVMITSGGGFYVYDTTYRMIAT